jgi:hypothetical protein
MLINNIKMETTINKLEFDYLDIFFKDKGFKKKDKTWYLKNNDAVILCNFQKSAYSELFYLNFGIAFIDLFKSNKIPPPTTSWQWSARYEKFLEKIKIDFTTNVKAITNEGVARNMNKITQNIEAHILPTLFKFTDYNFLKTLTIKDFETTIIRLTYIKGQDFIDYVSTK